ncbi:MAG: hypothetical protein H0U76_00675, partial [Ktedonobacteraceae bacterium]|nr:hypothetical protein [Ktedonobacteraceae bacterium]
PGTAHDQAIGYDWHNYRIEIHGARVDFYIDDQLSGRAICQTKTVANGPIKFTVSDIELRMSEFRVVVA